MNRSNYYLCISLIDIYHVLNQHWVFGVLFELWGPTARCLREFKEGDTQVTDDYEVLWELLKWEQLFRTSRRSLSRTRSWRKASWRRGAWLEGVSAKYLLTLATPDQVFRFLWNNWWYHNQAVSIASEVHPLFLLVKVLLILSVQFFSFLS